MTLRLATVAALLLLTGPAMAKDYPVKIASARVGLPPGGVATERDENGQAVHIAKFACWAPVYVDLEIRGTINEPAELVIESPDPDEITTTMALPLNLAGTSGNVSAAALGVIGYLRPAGSGDATIFIRSKDGKALSEPFRVRSLRPREPLTYVVLALGGPLSGFDLPKPATSTNEPSVLLRGGRVEPTVIADINQLPDQWIGYEAADLAILNTGPGTEQFLDHLFGNVGNDSDKRKRAALLEWVRRGGRLVVSVGANAANVAQLPALRDLLPFDVKGSQTVDTLALYWSAREASQSTTLNGLLGAKGATFPFATLTPKDDRQARVLIPPPERRANSREIIAVQSAFGLGRVTLIAFDLDRKPFTDFNQLPEFWDWVLREGGANRASANDRKTQSSFGGPSEEEDDLAVALRTYSDTFDGVPVVSFGWVALLIVLYIILIGPIEYFFLKRVLGRLELTWITFPVIVLTVSLAAYFSAYAIKGRDLKINKVDVVDVDPASGRIYGTTWFTIFSPRIDTYTLDVTPADGWATGAEPGTAVSWVGAPRGGKASLLRRSYEYHSDERSAADGLEHVPIQVWSTKSFVANWSGGFDSGAPVVTSGLHHPPADPAAVIGTFVNRMPVPVLSDCMLFYAGQVYSLPGGTVRTGETVRIVLDKGTPTPQWFQSEGRLNELLGHAQMYSDRRGAGRPAGAQFGSQNANVGLPLWGLLFHEASLKYAEEEIPRNASLRRIDHSWRLADNRNEVILVGRAALPIGPAEETLSGSSSPSRLWLRGLPGSGERAPIPGTGRQETWVRVYLPVK